MVMDSPGFGIEREDDDVGVKETAGILTACAVLEVVSALPSTLANLGTIDSALLIVFLCDLDSLNACVCRRKMY